MVEINGDVFPDQDERTPLVFFVISEISDSYELKWWDWSDFVISHSCKMQATKAKRGIQNLVPQRYIP